MRKLILSFLILPLLLSMGVLNAAELPRPTYDNSLLFTITHSFLSEQDSEINYIKSQFGNGMYAPLYFSKFHHVAMDWTVNPSQASSGTTSFKSEIDKFVAFAKKHDVGVHITLNYGLSRTLSLYEDAKTEDIRNAQWYNDNNILSDSQRSNSGDSVQFTTSEGLPVGTDNIPDVEPNNRKGTRGATINGYVTGTLSRYARKMRSHLDAKVAEAFKYVKQQQDANPDITILISAPGEVELSRYRLQPGSYLQDFFCDYSPFAVLEFRDWIKHEGLYASGSTYSGQGYGNGGSRYQGANGLSNFNADFGTSFSSWDLKYYNWSLNDTVDTNYTDGSNPDSNTIPSSQYNHNGMKPSSGSNYVSGGFDPPREMKHRGVNAYYDLWNSFREHMVMHYVKDMAKIARDSGFPKGQYFTHQIPADYIFGGRGYDDPDIYPNPRYYSSASPMWTADVYSDIQMGLTIYNLAGHSSTEYGVPAADALGDDWAALEYDPETNTAASLSSVNTLYNDMIKVYDGGPHVINFFKWQDPGDEHQMKGTRRETAAKQFFDVIKNKARQSTSTMFTGPAVSSLSGSQNSGTGLVDLSWSSKIWSNLSYTWSQWGDFKEFAIYRGYTSNFTANSSSKIGQTTSTSFSDGGFNSGTTVYYKVAPVNDNGVAGTTQAVSVSVSGSAPVAVMNVSRTQFNFCAVVNGDAPPNQNLLVYNSGNGILNWSATDNAAWLSAKPASGSGDGFIYLFVDPSGMGVGSYTATVTVTDPNATNSPQTIDVNLTIKSASEDKKPFGTMESPDASKVQYGCILVSGWVLDDIGVKEVKVFRDPVAGEPNQLRELGTADLVADSRSDIVIQYPDYPANYKAGWGYMLLTNFLPNQGNGSFKIYAIAEDSRGQTETLGSMTITCDNASAVKPFGAIDTPEQGGDASGTSFYNWGWVLAHNPNMIPTNGSTIEVFIDSKIKGNPEYNIPRSDIQKLFPGYKNTDGAVGFFLFDTTQYSEGRHLIYWLAKDDAGNVDGIGSRFFIVRNSAVPDGASAQSRTAGTAKYRTHTAFPIGQVPRIDLDKNAAVGVKILDGKDTPPRPVKANREGVINIDLRELQLVQVHISPEAAAAKRGTGSKDSIKSVFGGFTNNMAYQVVDGRWQALPIGSTFDAEKGIFHWVPAPGFFGQYLFDFITREGTPGKLVRKRVKIRIRSKN